MSIESVMLTDHLTLCCPTLLFSLQSFLASGAFLVSRLFASGGQNIGASASTAILPMSTQGWFPVELTDLISLQSKGLSKASVIWRSAFFMVQHSQFYMTTGRIIAMIIIWTFVSKGMSLLFNTLSSFYKAFLPRSRCLFMAAVTIPSDSWAEENKIYHCFHIFPLYLLWSDGTSCRDLSFLNVEF